MARTPFVAALAVCALTLVAIALAMSRIGELCFDRRNAVRR